MTTLQRARPPGTGVDRWDTSFLPPCQPGASAAPQGGPRVPAGGLSQRIHSIPVEAAPQDTHTPTLSRSSYCHTRPHTLKHTHIHIYIHMHVYKRQTCRPSCMHAHRHTPEAGLLANIWKPLLVRSLGPPTVTQCRQLMLSAQVGCRHRLTRSAHQCGFAVVYLCVCVHLCACVFVCLCTTCFL